MKITYVDVSHTREEGFDYVSLFVHRGKEIHHYNGHSQHFFERAMLLLSLFYGKDR